MKEPYRMERADQPSPIVLGTPDLGQVEEPDALTDKLPQLMDRWALPAGAAMQGKSSFLKLKDGRFWDVFLIAHRVTDMVEQALVRGKHAIEKYGEMNQIIAQQQQMILQLATRVTELEALVPGATQLTDRIDNQG